ncbi:MAG: hypothetical protein IPH71_09880 [Proteobacteria bacterium]|nr:hypothetical protein [Pseudomonadota bacterium]
MPGAAQRAADFRQLCDFIGAEYAYFDIKATDWRATCDTIKPLATAARTRDEFVAALEQALGQLYDSHAHLGTNTRLAAARAYRFAATPDLAREPRHRDRRAPGISG